MQKPKRMSRDKEMSAVEMENEEEETGPIHGDLLEAIMSYIPLIDLVLVCRVSKTWKTSVFSSLTHVNQVKPWLFAHTQRSRSFESWTTQAYDPRSNQWIQIDKPVIKHASNLRSSSSNFLHVLSSTKFSFSTDPFCLKWRQITGPNVCRSNPIVALCGNLIVVAGSGWQFEDDPFAVEVYDPDLSTWRTCQPMPDILKDSAAATWLSVASDGREMFVTEKASGISYAFDPVSGEWRGPYDLRPDPRAYFSAVGFVGGDLIVACLIGNSGRPESLRIWKVDRETMACEPFCEAPAQILEKLQPENRLLRQIELSAAENFVYVFDPWEPAAVAFCEFGGGGGVWGSARNAAWNEDVMIAGNIAFTCGRVEIGDLQAAMRTESCRFSKIAGEVGK